MKARHPANEAIERSSHRISDRRSVSMQPETAENEGSSSSDHGRNANQPSDLPKAGWKDILWRTKEEMKNDNLSIVAAGVAFYVFLGIIPALGALISVWGLIAEPAVIQQQVDSMAGMLPAQVIEILDEQMTRIASQKSSALLGTIIGVLLAVWSGAKAMKSLITALNITYAEKETRGFIRLNVTAIALTVAGIAGFLLAVGIIVVLPVALGYVGLGSTAAALVNIVRWPLLAVFAAIGLSILYQYGPDRDPARWRWVSWGAVIATIMWIAVSAGFSFYVANFGSYNKTYGTLGAVVVFLLWLLISAYTVLFGAELNAEMEHQTKRDTTKGPDQPQGERNAYVADHLGSAKN
jgi:membrane protein